MRRGAPHSSVQFFRFQWKALQAICDGHEKLDLCLTEHGGHIEYWSSQRCQAEWGDPDPWWAWNRAIEWIEKQQQILLKKGN